MSAIDRVKELLAEAETECIGAVPCRRCDAHMKLESLAGPVAQALVESQAALKAMANCDNESCREFGCMCGDDALRMGALEKAMERWSDERDECCCCLYGTVVGNPVMRVLRGRLRLRMLR